MITLTAIVIVVGGICLYASIATRTYFGVLALFLYLLIHMLVILTEFVFGSIRSKRDGDQLWTFGKDNVSLNPEKTRLARIFAWRDFQYIIRDSSGILLVYYESKVPRLQTPKYYWLPKQQFETEADFETVCELAESHSDRFRVSTYKFGNFFGPFDR